MADESDYDSQSDYDHSLSQQPGASSSNYSAPVLSQPTPKGTNTKGKPKGKGKAKGAKGNDGDVKRRSTKACDNCRKAKSKCARIFDPATGEPVGKCENCIQVGAECTFNGATRKRGPPKGYIEAIESRLHRMEALLGGLLQNDDPRAQALLGELIGDEDSRDMLARDLKAATGSNAKPEKSWKREFALQQEAQALQEKKERQASNQPPAPPTPASYLLQPPSHSHSQNASFNQGRGFGQSSSSIQIRPVAGGSQLSPTNWFNEEDLGFSEVTFSGSPQTDQPQGNSPQNFLSTFSTSSNPLDFTTSPLPLPAQSYSTTHAQSIPIPSPNLDQSTSPRQRRRLESHNPQTQSISPVGDERKQMAFHFTLPSQSTSTATTGSSGSARTKSGTTGSVLPKGAIGHTGQSSYTLSGSTSSPRPRSTSTSTRDGGAGFGEEFEGGMRASVSPVGERGREQSIINNGQREGGGGGEGPDDELADVIGQLSLNENEEVRYHGRSSGLYLISKSRRFRDFFWQFPSAGVWPPADGRVAKTEREILELGEGEDPLPDLETQHQLLQAYWTWVHPSFPIIYKVSFMRQYRHSLAHSNSSTSAASPSNSFGHGPVPTVLLLSMFALSARYCDLDPTPGSDGKLWDAGQKYLDSARKILNHEYSSSKLVMVQALLLMAYREIGVGQMSSAWMGAGMAIRMAQDLGLFRDVEKWFLPVQRFTHEEKQTRKRIWWGCIIIDRYTSSYIGRPGAIHERDYDTGFCSEDEPDEHEQWRPIRLDGTDWHSPPKNSDSQFPDEIARGLKNYPTMRANTLSCFNAHAALAVIINRIISNIYAIRIRVLGQSSESLLSLLDQSLASWFLALPPHLAYNPASSKVPAPHILSLHLQFYSSLILLHRPFIPGQNSSQSPGNFPSHSICTTSANAIANIVTAWRKTFTLRQCPPFVTYPLFSAAIICVYNASFDEALARPAKIHLLQCMNALKEMELQWGSAIRAFELLHGLVDLRDADLNAELAGLNAEGEGRGTKRQTMDVDEPSNETFADLRPTNFHNNSRPVVGRSTSTSKRRQNSSTSRTSKVPSQSTSSIPQAVPSPSIPQVPFFGDSPQDWRVPPTQASTPLPDTARRPSDGQPLFSHHLPDATSNPSAQTFDILNPSLDLSQFRSPPGTSGGGSTNFSDLLNSFLSPTEQAGISTASSLPPVTIPMQQQGGPHSFNAGSAFFEMPLGVVDDWYQYSFNAFGGDSGAGSTPGSVPTGAGAGGGGSSMSPEAPHPPA